LQGIMGDRFEHGAGEKSLLSFLEQILQ